MTWFSKALIIFGACAAAAATAGAAPAPATPSLPGADAAARRIDRGSLEATVRYLSDDLLEGRGPATRGDLLSRLYLASSLELLGFEPGGPGGSWQQPFEIVGVAAKMPDLWPSTPAASASTCGAGTTTGEPPPRKRGRRRKLGGSAPGALPGIVRSRRPTASPAERERDLQR